MKLILLVIAIFSTGQAWCQEDYVIHLNDTTLNIALDKHYNIVVNGKKLDFILSQKDTLSYEDNLYSFQYPKGFKVSNNKLDAGIEQISILTAEGSGILIQRYETLNPTTLNEMMLKEITKESINYGYKSIKTTYKKILKSGQEIEITKAVLRYKDEVNIYEIASLGKKDAGIIIVTIRMDENEDTQGQKLIELMWQSIKAKW